MLASGQLSIPRVMINCVKLMFGSKREVLFPGKIDAEVTWSMETLSRVHQSSMLFIMGSLHNLLIYRMWDFLIFHINKCIFFRSGFVFLDVVFVILIVSVISSMIVSSQID